MTCCLLKQWSLREFVKEFLVSVHCYFLQEKLNHHTTVGISWNIRHLQDFDFWANPAMFCFSTLNANTNPIPNLAANAVPAKPAWAPTLATNTVAKPAWAPTLAANTVAKPAWAPTLASRAIIMLSNPVIEILQVPYIPTDPNLDARSFNDPRDLHMTDTLNSKKNRYANLLSLMACVIH